MYVCTYIHACMHIQSQVQPGPTTCPAVILTEEAFALPAKFSEAMIADTINMNLQTASSASSSTRIAWRGLMVFVAAFVSVYTTRMVV